MSVFSTYLIVFLLKFRSGELVGCRIWFRIQRVPTVHTFDGPTTQKIRNTWKNVMMMSSSHFFRYFLFSGRGVHQKYGLWVLVRCKIIFHIQWTLPLRISVKTQGDMSKIRTKKVVFFYDKYVNSTIMVDSFYWNSIGSWIPTHKIYCWHVFLLGPF